MRLKRKRFSIISRLKLFSFTTPFTDKLRKEFGFDEKLANTCDKVNIHVQPSDDYKRQYNQSSETNRTKDNKFKEDLKKNPNTWFSDAPDDDPKTNTHFLGKESNTTSSKQEKRFVMFSKWINDADRFNYKVYKPTVIIDDITKERTYYQKIVLASCLEHTNNGAPGSYVKGQTGNTWHSSSKAAKRKRKLLKQNKKDDLN